MKFEKINNSQCRFTLTGKDLASRMMTVSELTYGSPKTRLLFTEIMDIARKQLGFETKDVPLRIEIIPLQGDSILLQVTKVDNPDELDQRFSRFSPGEEDWTESMTDLTPEDDFDEYDENYVENEAYEDEDYEDDTQDLDNGFLEDLNTDEPDDLTEDSEEITQSDGEDIFSRLSRYFSDYLSKIDPSANVSFDVYSDSQLAPAGTKPARPEPSESKKKSVSTASYLSFTFRRFEDVERAAEELHGEFDAKNSLYSLPDGQYILLVDLKADDSSESRLLHLNDFAESAKVGRARAAWISEHGKLLIKDHALKKLYEL